MGGGTDWVTCKCLHTCKLYVACWEKKQTTNMNQTVIFNAKHAFYTHIHTQICTQTAVVLCLAECPAFIIPHYYLFILVVFFFFFTSVCITTRTTAPAPAPARLLQTLWQQHTEAVCVLFCSRSGKWAAGPRATPQSGIPLISDK